MATQTTTGTSVVHALKWRYATKKFDSAKKIPADVWHQLAEALVLSPSSFGLQPYKFVVITDQKVKEELVGASWHQKQPAECSHLVVFCRLENMGAAHVEEYIKRLSETRHLPVENLAEYKKMMLDFVNNSTPEQINDWAAKQAYIALGNLMTSAALLHVDNCPMEGFVKEEYDRILDLPAKGLRSVVLCALGYRAEDDKYSHLAKVRFPESDLIIKI